MLVEKKASDLINRFTMEDISINKESNDFFSFSDNPINYEEAEVKAIKSKILESFYKDEGSYSNMDNNEVSSLIAHQKAIALLEDEAKDTEELCKLIKEYTQEHLDYSVNLIK